MRGRFEILPEFFKLTLVLTLYLTMYIVSAMAVAALCKAWYGVDFLALNGVPLDVNVPKNLDAIKMFQLLSSVIVFIGTAFMAANLFTKHPLRYLGVKRGCYFSCFVLAALAMLLLTPFVNYTYKLNTMLPLPQWMEALENEASTYTKAFLNMPNVSVLLYNILILAVVPAIGEELLFRGVIQRLLYGMVGNAHWAIICAAVFFSSMHMQFLGFIPRLAMGIVLGYLFYWSGSLWLSILAHFINNAATVLMAYYADILPFNQDTIGADKGDAVLLIVTVAAVWACLWLIKHLCDRGSVNTTTDVT